MPLTLHCNWLVRMVPGPLRYSTPRPVQQERRVAVPGACNTNYGVVGTVERPLFSASGAVFNKFRSRASSFLGLDCLVRWVFFFFPVAIKSFETGSLECLEVSIRVLGAQHF